LRAALTIFRRLGTTGVADLEAEIAGLEDTGR
jgi:hypothetical protein